MTLYTDDYKEQAFWIWYNAGKITAAQLVLELDKPGEDSPHHGTLMKWMRSWRERAAELDQEVKDKFAAEVIETKVEMMRRHSEVGKDLQAIGIDWIIENKDKLTAATAARIIKDGYEMERLSVGVPEALEKMLSVSDEELKKQIESVIAGDDLDLFDADQ